MKLGALLGRLFDRQPKPLDEPINFDDKTFSRPGKKHSFVAAWADVTKITGFKIDLLTFDEIRMEIQLGPSNVVIVTEESPGFKEFMAEVERRFPSVVGWHAKVSQPPFATSVTVLYEPPN